MKSRRVKGLVDEANGIMLRLHRDGDWEKISEILSRGEWDPNRPVMLELQPRGGLLLRAAVLDGQTAVAKQLIALGADPNASMPGETKLLREVCVKGRLDMVECLIQAGADVNARCSVGEFGDSGETPLMESVQFGHREVAETLLRHGARADLTTRRGRSALSIALSRTHGSPDMVRFLLDVGCPVDARDLHYAVLRRDLVLFELLRARQPDVTKPFDWPTDRHTPTKHDTPLFVVVDSTFEELGYAVELAPKRDERLAILDRLIADGADVNAQRGGKAFGWTPLMWAVFRDDDEIAKRLLAAGADPAKGFVAKGRPASAISFAEESPKLTRVRKLLLGHE